MEVGTPLQVVSLFVDLLALKGLERVKIQGEDVLGALEGICFLQKS